MSPSICSVESCDKPVRAREWCMAHYMRWKRCGDPLGVRPAKRKGGMSDAEFKAWFEAQFRVEEGPFDTPCWVWTRGTFSEGYGKVTLNGRTQKVHRVAWKLRYGEIPDGLLIRHIDDHNKLCANPEHLCLGTYSDNLRDRWRVRRAASA